MAFPAIYFFSSKEKEIYFVCSKCKRRAAYNGQPSGTSAEAFLSFAPPPCRCADQTSIHLVNTDNVASAIGARVQEIRLKDETKISVDEDVQAVTGTFTRTTANVDIISKSVEGKTSIDGVTYKWDLDGRPHLYSWSREKGVAPKVKDITYSTRDEVIRGVSASVVTNLLKHTVRDVSVPSTLYLMAMKSINSAGRIDTATLDFFGVTAWSRNQFATKEIVDSIIFNRPQDFYDLMERGFSIGGFKTFSIRSSIHDLAVVGPDTLYAMGRMGIGAPSLDEYVANVCSSRRSDSGLKFPVDLRNELATNSTRKRAILLLADIIREKIIPPREEVYSRLTGVNLSSLIRMTLALQSNKQVKDIVNNLPRCGTLTELLAALDKAVIRY